MSNEQLKMSEEGIRFLKSLEGKKLKAYQDTNGTWTIGYGHTGAVDGVPVGKGMLITPEKAEELLRLRLPEYEAAVHSVKQPLTQHQFDALTSFAFNNGASGFKKSGVFRLLSLGDYESAADKLLEFSKEKNPDYQKIEGAEEYRLNKGLFNRRKKERAYFLGLPESETPPAPPKTFEPFDLPTPPKPNYDKQLAAAFGIEPKTDGVLPEYISSLVKSIYDKTFA